MIALAASAWYLPETSVNVAELPELATLSETEHATCAALGVDRVPADDTLTAADLAARAGRRALATAGLDAADVDVVLTVEPRAPQTLVSSEATRLQAVLGADRAMAFSVGGLGCASLTPALLAARGLLHADPDLANVLVLHGSKPATPGRYRHPVTVNGDSGGALLVRRRGELRIRDILLETNGAYADLFRVEYRDEEFARWREECTDPAGYSFRLAVETRNRLRDLVARLLGRNGLTPADVPCYLTQNLSTAAFRNWSEALGVPIAKACSENLARCGHLGPNDVFFNLSTARETGEFDGRAVLLNISPAAAWSALLVTTDDTTSHEL
ncbi:3-oxoacyl-ACP synthase III [Amycolatopsis vancoresmycina]|uniref:3-oxoacyl-[acyl-carrier-protein] synthase III n=1 Tax=Amycolatopsis vancoresmycina DSM 44592 TaxID=1292037 RepID=R1FFN7_9PSEU|nr:3-oxoacyl-ACP synthase III [Amycolatopsis vancoresmycina]EOD58428.1 3-oxoacyl-[acyl-carrier-protein] synthase III [Amycolatopsis vancoresmycina DSM 44592]